MNLHDRYPLHPAMLISALVFLVLSIIISLMIPYNEVLVLGVNAYIKPLKFSISIAIYLLTFAWILPMIQDKKLTKWFSILAISTMVIEQLVITWQAARGVQSHFNHSTALDDAIYGLMGLFILSITLYTAFLTFKFSKQSDGLNTTLKTALIWGLWIFVAGSFIGGIMSGIDSHAVGAPMGEEGMLFTNWSTKAGDLRVAHFAGLHALQFIPLAGYFIMKSQLNHYRQIVAVRAFSIFYTVLVILLLALALGGKPLMT